MHIEYLREFRALAQCSSFVAAAESLYITQPALSNHIKTLEDEFGVPLVNRGKGKRTTLTKAGATLVNRSNELLSLFDSIKAECYELNRRYKGRLNVRLPMFTESSIQPFIDDVKSFGENNPDIEIVFIPGRESSNPLVALSNEVIDCCLVAAPAQQRDGQEHIYPPSMAHMHSMNIKSSMMTTEAVDMTDAIDTIDMPDTAKRNVALNNDGQYDCGCLGMEESEALCDGSYELILYPNIEDEVFVLISRENPICNEKRLTLSDLQQMHFAVRNQAISPLGFQRYFHDMSLELQGEPASCSSVRDLKTAVSAYSTCDIQYSDSFENYLVNEFRADDVIFLPGRYRNHPIIKLLDDKVLRQVRPTMFLQYYILFRSNDCNRASALFRDYLQVRCDIQG